MRLLATADLHYNHAKSIASADEIIAEMNAAGGDVLLVVGDTAASEGDAFERALSKFTFAGPKLVLAGNHELWTRGDDSERLLFEDYPKRAAAIGWQWIERDPFTAGNLAVVGSVGWYDYDFAAPSLGIPRRFYEQKISPGAAERFEEFAGLFASPDDVPPHAREIVARWNDGRHVKLHRSDVDFLALLLDRLDAQLQSVATAKHVVAAVHHVPFAELLPPTHGSQWDFAKAYLGSPAIGRRLQRYANVSHVLCGHSHFAAEAQIGAIRAINIGSGYRHKRFITLDIAE